MKTRITLVLLHIVLLPTAVKAEGMTLKQVAELKQVVQAEVSPDGQYVAYTRMVPRKLFEDKDGPAWAELHVIGPEGRSRTFVTGQVNVSAIGWTPDSRQITYLAQREGETERALYGIPRDGGESRKLATRKEGIRGYNVHPDGKRVALLGLEPDNAGLKKERDKGFTQIVFEEDWKPVRLWLGELDNDDAKSALIELDGSVQEVLWSPAGDRLALKITPREMVDDVLMFNRIRILDPQGKELSRIDNPGKLGRMAWSPDGEHLAFIATESLHDTREGRLMVAGKDGGKWLHLLPDLAGHVWHVAWRDKTTVVFISYEGVGARLGTIQVDGTRPSTPNASPRR